MERIFVIREMKHAIMSLWAKNSHLRMRTNPVVYITPKDNNYT